MNPLTQSKNTTILPVLIALTLGCFAPSPTARAVDPPPDGGYPNHNTAEGQDALFRLTTGVDNTAVGFDALYHNIEGSFNTATGSGALFNNKSDSNTAIGFKALFSNKSGSSNTAIGFQALQNNTFGGPNTAVGYNALQNSTNSVDNTAVGYNALTNDIGGSSNTAIGHQALESNTSGGGNTAIGIDSLAANTLGDSNTANGTGALFFNTTGDYNSAFGRAALPSNTTGDNNTASGTFALENNTTGSNNIALGWQAGENLTTGDSNIDIGNPGVAGESRRIRIGRPGTHDGTLIAGIRGVTTQNADAIPVLIDSDGQLGTMSSSRRFKKEIKPMDQISEAILGLKPVTFHYKSDPAGAGPQFGLIAEEVAQVNPNLVVRDENGEIYTVRYDAVNAMLLNEFLKEHKAFLEEQRTVEELKKQVAALTAGLQKVSAQLELSKAAPQTVLNNQ